jgi:hypothetical protein
MAAQGIPGKVYSLPGYTAAYGAPFLTPNMAMGGAGRVFWVGNGTLGSGTFPSGNGSNPDYPMASILTAFKKTVAGRGDIIYVLPGHAENIATATAWADLKSNTKIVGLGSGIERPIFTFTTTASQLAVGATVSSVLIRGCQFYAAGPRGTTALTVTAPFSISGAGFQFIENEVQCGVDADQLATDCFSLAATADDATFYGNYIWGGAGSVITTVLKTTGAVDRLKLFNNTITAEVATAATGVLLDLSQAAIADNLIMGNYLANNTASAKFVIKPHATSTGFVDNNVYFTGDGATAPASSAWSTYTTTYKFGANNKCVTAVSVSAIVSPAVDS